MRPRSARRSEPRRRLALQRTSPDSFPVLPADVGDAAVALIELIGNLKHRQHQPALRRPGDMAAAALAPNEFAGLDLEPGGEALLVDELALEHVRLLDLHVLMVGQDGAGRKAHQRGDEPALAVEQQRLDLAAGKAGLLPLHIGRAYDVRMLLAGLLRLGGDGIHGRSSLIGYASAAAMIAQCDAVRRYNSSSRIGGWNASPVSQGK